MFSIVFSEDSLFDLKEIADYISKNNPFYATSVVNAIYDCIENLEYFPYLGKERKGSLREIVDPRYGFRIMYKIQEVQERAIIVSIFKYKNNWE